MRTECAQLVSSMLLSKEGNLTSATHVGRPSSTQVTCAPFSSSARQYTIFGSSWNFCMRKQALLRISRADSFTTAAACLGERCHA